MTRSGEVKHPPRVSVIVAMFDTERYIEECLRSVREQTLSSWECIVVDDGSTDGGLAVARTAVAGDSRFRILSQANGGHSVARNRGLDEASGDYVICLDSDDRLPADALESLLALADKDGADIATGIAESFQADRVWINPQMRELSVARGVYRSIREAPELVRDASPCNKLIRRSLIERHGLRFPLGIPVREDLHLVLRAYGHASKIVIDDKVVYHYRLRDESDAPSHTQLVRDDVLTGIVRVHRELTEFLTRNDLLSVRSAMTAGLLGNVTYRLLPYLRGEPQLAVLEEVATFTAQVDDSEIEFITAMDERVVVLLMAGRHFDLARDFALQGLSAEVLNHILTEELHHDPRLVTQLLYYQQRWVERLRRTKSGGDIRGEVGRLVRDKATRTFGPLPTKRSIGRELKIAAARVQVKTEPRSERPLWVIGERRGTSAEDTGYHLFRHMRLNRPDIDSYFICKDDAKFVEAARSLGNVVRFGALDSFSLLMRADVLCYSDSCLDLAHKWARVRPHVPERTFGCFLQHGVIGLHAMRGFYDREQMLERGEIVDGFVVSSTREAQLVHEQLHHPMENILVTGLSRHDALTRGPAGTRQVLFMPTWRPWLKSVGDITYFQSEYAKTVQAFLSSKALDDMLVQNQLTMVVCQHFAMGRGTPLRSTSGAVSVVWSDQVSIQQLVRESDLMISDYSSVTHDFAYQARPVIYWMFDRERFYRQSGPLLDPANDLAGPVVSTHDELIAEVARYAARGFEVEPHFASRCDAIFDHRDGGACERLMSEIELRRRRLP